MTITMELEGAKEVEATLKKLQSLVGKEVADAMVTTGNLVAGDARKSIQQRSMGAPTVRYHKGRSMPKAHVASRPGDPPNTDTGQLAGAVTVVVKSDAVYVGVGRAGVRVYAEALEFAKSSKRRRPFMQPAIDGRRADYLRLLRKATQDAVRSATRGS